MQPVMRQSCQAGRALRARRGGQWTARPALRLLQFMVRLARPPAPLVLLWRRQQDGAGIGRAGAAGRHGEKAAANVSGGADGIGSLQQGSSARDMDIPCVGEEKGQLAGIRIDGSGFEPCDLGV